MLYKNQLRKIIYNKVLTFKTKSIISTLDCRCSKWDKYIEKKSSVDLGDCKVFLIRILGLGIDFMKVIVIINVNIWF